MRSNEEDNAKLKKMNVEKDEIIDSKQNKKIHPNHVSSLINISKQRYSVLISCFTVSWNMFC
jgi:hypothetical protein